MPRQRADWAKIIELAELGYSRRDTAKLVGCTVATISNVLRPLGLLCPKRVAASKKAQLKIKAAKHHYY